MAKAKAFNLDQHAEIGKDLNESKQILSKQSLKAEKVYGATIYKKYLKAIDSIDKIRFALENKACKENPDSGNAPIKAYAGK